MHSGSIVLVIIVKRLFQIFKALCSEHPGIADGIILIKNIFREPVGVIQNNMPFINLHHKAAAVKNQRFVFFLCQSSGLRLLIVMNHLTDFHAVLVRQMIVASHHIRSGLFRKPKEPFIKIRRNPVVAVNESNPFTLCPAKPQIFGPALLFIDRRRDYPHLFRIFPLIIVEYFQRIIGRTVIHRNDFIIGNGLIYKTVHTPVQFFL